MGWKVISRTSLTVALVEDERHRMFIYRYLIKRGRKAREVRIVLSPSGRGSAEAWVRKRFAKEIRTYRHRHAQTDLIVIIDADALSVRERLSQLDNSLAADGQGLVGQDERVARLVPKRNIETWALCLNGTPVDEDTDYKSRTINWTEQILSAAESLPVFTAQTSEPPKSFVESLRSGITDLKRLTP